MFGSFGIPLDKDSAIAAQILELSQAGGEPPKEQSDRGMLAPSVYTLGHSFKDLCASHGCPLDQERMHGEGDFAGRRLPKVECAAILGVTRSEHLGRSMTLTRRS